MGGEESEEGSEERPTGYKNIIYVNENVRIQPIVYGEFMLVAFPMSTIVASGRVEWRLTGVPHGKTSGNDDNSDLVRE